MAGIGESASLGSFDVGVDAGLKRAERHDLAVPRDQLEGSLSLGREVLESWSEPLSARSTELYAELLTIASISRLAYEHEPLTREQLASYLEHSLDFWNSWGHLY